MTIDDITAEMLIPFVVGSTGNYALAAERATRTFDTKVTEYHIRQKVAADKAVRAEIRQQIEATAGIEVWDVWWQEKLIALSSLSDLKPSEAVRNFAALTLAIMRPNANDNTGVDIPLEAQRIAMQYDQSAAEVEAELRALVKANRQVK